MATTTNKNLLIRPEHYVYSHITKIPGVCGGKATIDGRRVRVMDIAYMHRWGLTPEQMLEDYEFLNLAQIHAALSYYYENREEIESEMKSDEGWAERFEREKAEFLKKRASSGSR